MTETESLLTPEEAVRRVRADHDLLLHEVAGRTDAELAASYEVTAGPLGDFCESLHDLMAHIMMWDEINLAVLTEDHAGRRHWSLDPTCETTEAGRQLNRSGVAAGRELPVSLVLHRLRLARDGLLAELGSASSISPLAQRVMTVPGAPPFWHCAVHLGCVPDVG